MKIIAVHNRYQVRGGEDRAFEAECALLEARGHRVVRYVADNLKIGAMGQARLLAEALWNFRAAAQLRALIERENPALVHFHNTFPLLSASILRAAMSKGVPVVRTLHNFRRVCPNGLLLRDGRPCQLCVGRGFAWPGIRYGCYRGSRSTTLVAALATAIERRVERWHDGRSAYIAVSEFARRILCQGGLPRERVTVKPNFVALDPGPGDGSGGFALYLGRLSEEKGLRVLVKAWNLLRSRSVLRIAGTGPLAGWLASQCRDGIEWLGVVPHADGLELLRRASLLVVPSLCYEGCPLVVLEAFAAGTPVVASDMGGLAELVRQGETGWLAPAGDAEGLAAVLERALADRAALSRMRRLARLSYEQRFTAEHNYRMLIEIYRQVGASE